MQSGERRWVACEAGLPNAGELGSFANVIEVSSTIINTIVPDRGSDFGEGCSCTGFDVSPTSLPSNPDSSSGSEVVDITGRPYGCSGNWTAWDDGGWLTVSSTGSSLSATGKQDSVTVSWTTNTSPSSRSSSVTIADHCFPLTQRGAPTPTCSSFDISPTYKSTGPSAGNQSVTITGYPSGCQGKAWTATNGSWVTVSPSSGTGIEQPSCLAAHAGHARSQGAPPRRGSRAAWQARPTLTQKAGESGRHLRARGGNARGSPPRT